jgi:hypothetical protein
MATHAHGGRGCLGKGTKEGTCAVRLRRVMNERRRLEMIIWQRAYDTTVVALRMATVQCIHADLFRAMVNWVDVHFFYNLVDPGLMSPSARHAHQQVAHPHECGPACVLLFKDQGVRFLTAFVSHAAPIRGLLTQHRDTLYKIKACCNGGVHDELFSIPYDLSMHIFRDLNVRFFNGLFKLRQMHTKHHMLNWVRMGTYRKCKLSEYTKWLAVHVLHKSVHLEVEEAEAAPEVAKKEAAAPEQVDVLFLT